MESIWLDVKSYEEIPQEQFKEERVEVLKELASFIQKGYESGLMKEGQVVIKTSQNGVVRYDSNWATHGFGWGGITSQFRLDPISKWGKKSVDFERDIVEKVWYKGRLLFDNGIDRYWNMDKEESIKVSGVDYPQEQTQIPFHYKSKRIGFKCEGEKIIPEEEAKYYNK